MSCGKVDVDVFNNFLYVVNVNDWWLLASHINALLSLVHKDLGKQNINEECNLLALKIPFSKACHLKLT